MTIFTIIYPFWWLVHNPSWLKSPKFFSCRETFWLCNNRRCATRCIPRQRWPYLRYLSVLMAGSITFWLKSPKLLWMEILWLCNNRRWCNTLYTEARMWHLWAVYLFLMAGPYNLWPPKLLLAKPEILLAMCNNRRCANTLIPRWAWIATHELFTWFWMAGPITSDQQAPLAAGDPLCNNRRCATRCIPRRDDTSVVVYPRWLAL